MNKDLPCIVILGAAVWKGGLPSPSLKRRITRAAEVYLSGASDLIIASGGLGKHPPSEAQVMLNELILLGVPKEAIALESNSTTTFENAAFSIQKLTEHNKKSVIVVTDAYHIPRALLTFRVLGVSAIGKCPASTKGSSLHRRITFWFRELFALPVYTLSLLKWRLFNGVLPRP